MTTNCTPQADCSQGHVQVRDGRCLACGATAPDDNRKEMERLSEKMSKIDPVLSRLRTLQSRLDAAEKELDAWRQDAVKMREALVVVGKSLVPYFTDNEEAMHILISDALASLTQTYDH